MLALHAAGWPTKIAAYLLQHLMLVFHAAGWPTMMPHAR